MGGEFLLGINRKVRKGAGVEASQAVDVTLELDVESRDVGGLREHGFYPRQGVGPLGRGGKARGDPQAPSRTGGCNDPVRENP